MLVGVVGAPVLQEQETNPKACSSIAVEKASLEKEVQQLEQKITELER